MGRQVTTVNVNAYHIPLDSLDPLDDFGFQIRPHFYWLPEPPEDEVERLEMNLAIYQEYINNGSRFTDHINDQRTIEYKRAQVLRRLLNEVVQARN